MFSTKFINTACRLTHICRALYAPTAANVGFCKANYHFSMPLRARTYVDRENQYAHEVLVQSLKPYQIFEVPAAEQTIDTASQQSTLPQHILTPPAQQLSPDEAFADFCALIEHCVRTQLPIQDDSLTPFLERFCDSTSQLSDEQLLAALQQLTRLPPAASTRTHNYMALWNNLDIECCQRIDRWSSAQLLLVCDAWYVLGLARIGEFVWQALRKLGRKIRKMPPEQLVQSMFLCNVLRRPIFEMFEFEVNLARCAADMTLQELGVMSMGFFKTQTPIRNPELLALLYERLRQELDTVENITLVSLLKVLRYSSKIPQVPQLMQLLDELCDQVERISLLACLHVALLGCDLQSCHDKIIELILQRFDREMATVRLKDIERICLVIGLFNYDSSSGVAKRICSKIPAILRQPGRMDEILKYPRCYTNCMHFLTLRDGQYDGELLAAAFEPRFTRHAYKGLLLGREYFHLDSFIRINLQYGKQGLYEGPQLSDKQRRSMGKMYTQYLPERNSKFKLNTTDRLLVEIRECAATLFKAHSFKHVLPHYERCDLVICYDQQARRALPISSTCAEDYSGVILTREQLLGTPTNALPAHVDTIVVVISGWNNVIRDKERHTGAFDMKIKQLQLLGHKTVVIYWHEWRELETAKDRQNFLKRRLAKVVQL